MATRRCCSFLPLPRLLLLLAVVLGTVLHDEAGVMASRPLLERIAEPPASAGSVAAGPGPGLGAATALVSGEGAGRHDDRSETGAEVILAGFGAALIVVIVCYIRVTRESSSSSSVGGVGEKHKRLGGF